MFESTRLKLTAWYLLIIMLISIFFSVAFYHASTQEVERVINRIEFRQYNPNRPIPERIPLRNRPTARSLEDLEHSKRQIFILLLIINGAIFVLAGGGGYFLAGRTLKPIKVMMDEQNEFISNASHQLRTPIATMRAEMEGNLLEKQISDKKARSLIMSNLEELSILQDLSNKLLEITQLHSLSGEKHLDTISILDILNTAKKKITPLAQKKHINIDIIAKDATVHGDKNKLIEVFVILLDNAIKYSKQKTTITISSEQSEHRVKVLVADEGLGISPTDLAHIFDRFYRADSSRSHAQGYGLGLSIAKNIVEIHHGLLMVTSKQNIGTTFSISLPAAPIS